MNTQLKTQSKNHWLRSLLLTVCCLTLVACGGGISGTGDGGPIINVGTLENVTGVDITGSDTTATEDTDTESTATQLQFFPSRLHININETLLAASNLNSRFPDLTVLSLSQQLATEFAESLQQSLQTLQHLNGLESQLLDLLLICDNTNSCDDLPATVTDSTQTIFSDIRYLPQTAGYFDKQLSFTTDNNTTVLRWTSDQQLVSLVTENNSALLYQFSDLARSRTTLRREDKLTSTILHSVLISQGSANSIEVDLHSDQQRYIRASADDESLILYAVHPTNPAITQVREAFNLSTSQFVIESCLTQSESCDSWQSDQSSTNNPADLFGDSQTSLGDFTQTLTADLTVTLPDIVNEFVIASATDQPQPAARALVCGGQRVFSNLRSFCWQPLPLDDSVQIFEESKTDDSTVYRLLPNTSIQ